MSDLWDDAMCFAKEEMGYGRYEYVDDWEELIARTKEHYGSFSKDRKNNYRKYQKTEEWKQLRKQVFEREKNKCIDCGKDSECIHHEHYNFIYTDNDVFACVSLCMVCHMKRHELCEGYNKNNIFIGKCYMCGKIKLITRVDSWSGVKMRDGNWIRGSWRNFCDDCVNEWGWENNREYNKCVKCFEKFVGRKTEAKCKECCGDSY